MTQKQPPLLSATLRWFLLAMILANIPGGMIFTLLAVYLSHLGASRPGFGVCNLAVTGYRAFFKRAVEAPPPLSA